MFDIFSITPIGLFLNRTQLIYGSSCFYSFNNSRSPTDKKDCPNYPNCHISEIHIIRLMSSKLDDN